MVDNINVKREVHLSAGIDNEILQSFVRVNIEDDGERESADTKEIEEKKIEKDVKKKDGISKKRKDGKNSKIIIRRRKRIRKAEELYTDKDRAAAVNMGTRDIKQSLKLKRQQDRSKSMQIPEEADPAQFLALGYYEMGRRENDIALNFINKALELNPLDKSALVSRSKCYILMGEPEKGLKDAETALNLDKKFLKAIYQKAESLYYMGDFEHSLMYFHRGLHVRPDHEDFKLGVDKAQKAIENALGIGFTGKVSTRTSTPHHKKTNSACTMQPSANAQSSVRSAISSNTSRSTNQKKLLRELAVDKQYLDNLLKNPNVRCKYKSEDDSIIKYIQETVDYLDKRQEFWRQQCPQTK